MLQVSFIRENIDLVKKKLAVKYFSNTGLIDEVIELDNKRRKLQFDKEEINAKINSSSKEIGAMMREGKKELAEQKKGEVSLLKEKLNDVSELNSIEEAIQTILLQIPNLPANEVPLGRTPAENDVVRDGGVKPTLHEGAMPHWDITNKYKLVDFELGNKITGSGFPVYTGKGAKLQRALIQYFLDFNTAAGYTEIMPPLMVNEASAYGTGQLPDKEGQMYFATEDKFYLIPTSEVPVTNIYRDEIIKEADLPVR
jgi:seryl-tRNA synthetase